MVTGTTTGITRYQQATSTVKRVQQRSKATHFNDFIAASVDKTLILCHSHSAECLAFLY
jgi:hypothetical protein